VLSVGAGQDAVWDSTSYAQQVEQRLAAAHFRFKHESFS
jgi:hypothetical protein